MKKYLMTGIAALTLCAGFTNCSNNDFEPMTQAQIDKSKYDQAFLAYVGSISPNQVWGFGDVANARTTRSDAVVTGDPFTFENTDSYYKTAVPETAKTYDEAMEYCTEVYEWGSNVNYNKMNDITEFELPNGTYSLHCWYGTRDIYVSGENVTLNVLGDQTSLNQARIYLLPQTTLNLNMDYYINNLEIYVAENATLNYNAESLYKQTGGGKIYSRGTVNLQKDNFELNQNAIFYNEGDIIGTSITSKPGDGNKSFLYNFGNLDLSGDMIMNSCTNFYNEGTADVDGKTAVTQQGIYWINKGHYVTNTMTFSAKNTQFYNFCQLIVENHCDFLDGNFNLMDNSYAEFNTAIFNNFSVNMGDNAGFNVKGSSKWGRQGAGISQGFFATNDNAKAYVRLAGQTMVPAHNGSAFQLQGANLTLAYNNITFYDSFDQNQIGLNETTMNNKTPYASISYSTPITKEELEGNNDGRTTWSLNNVTKLITGSDFASTGFSLTEGQCAATWRGTPAVVYNLRIIAEDLSASSATDFDFNDIVLDVKFDAANATICLRAAGGTLPLRIDGKDAWEVHKLFDVDTDYMVNTNALAKGLKGNRRDMEPVVFKLGRGITSASEAKSIKLEVFKNEVWQELTAPKGEPASKLAVGVGYGWLDERTSIKASYPLFVSWADGTGFTSQWWVNE